jgi:hypothetical protein
MEKERSQQEERIRVVREMLDLAINLQKKFESEIKLKKWDIDFIRPFIQDIHRLADSAFQIEIQDAKVSEGLPRSLIKLKTIAILWDEWEYEDAIRLGRNTLPELPYLAIHLADKHLCEPYRSQALEEIVKKVGGELECWSSYQRAHIFQSAASLISVDNPNRNQYLKELAEWYIEEGAFEDAFKLIEQMRPYKVISEEMKYFIEMVIKDRRFGLARFNLAKLALFYLKTPDKSKYGKMIRLEEKKFKKQIEEEREGPIENQGFQLRNDSSP